MTPRIKRSVERARNLVLAHIVGLRPGTELPTATRLSAMAEVSFVTMLRALRTLKEKGVLVGAAGHPFRVGANTSPTGSARKPSDPHHIHSGYQVTAWRRVAKRVAEDMTNGVFTPGAVLPTAKELQNRYKTSWAPLRKALADLCDKGVLEKHHRGFAVPSFASSAFRSRIVVVTRPMGPFALYLGLHDEEFFKALERCCMQARIALDAMIIWRKQSSSPTAPEYVVLERRSGRELEIDTLGRQDDRVVLGWIFLVHGQPDAMEEKIFRKLASSGKPTAILSEAGGWSLPREYVRGNRMQVHTITAAKKPGADVARWLLSVGHRRIAFVSPVHQYPWSQLRLQGMEETLQAMLPDARISAYTATTPPGAAPAPTDLYAFHDVNRQTLPPGQREEYDALMDSIRLHIVPRAQNRTVLYQLLNRVMEDMDTSGITAIAAVNDEAALMTLDFLKSRGLAVPRDVSVISFDDSVDALRLNLTSYNFNVPTVAMNMVGYILGRKPFADSGASSTKEVNGYVVERQTVGPL